MALIVRTLFNNQGWQAPCKSPYKDRECGLCFEPNVNIRGPSGDVPLCDGYCWEQDLSNKYRWGCTPQGRAFGRRAHIGMKVFFVYKQLDGDYTLWGKTTVQSTDKRVRDEGDEGGKGFALIHFSPFEALSKDRWVRNLTDVELVGEKWLMGRYRYIDSGREGYLEQFIEGGKAKAGAGGLGVTPPSGAPVLTIPIQITTNINDRVEEIAYQEGRQKDEVIREAIAEWLKRREL